VVSLTFLSSYFASRNCAPKNFSHSGSFLTLQPTFAADPLLLLTQILDRRTKGGQKFKEKSRNH